MTGKRSADCIKFLAVLVIFALAVSCSGPWSSPRGRRAPAKTEQAKAAPDAAVKAPQASPALDWVAFGLDREGSRISYDKKSVHRPPEKKAVAFVLLVTPLKDSKVLTEAQERLKKEDKDFQSLASLKMFCEANCETGTYDISKTVMVKTDGSAIAEQEGAVHDRKPAGEIKTLIEKLCAGETPGPLPKGSPQSAQKTCERAGVMILIQPQEAVAAGAKWRIEGGEWKTSGEKVCNLPVDGKSGKGVYRIEYREIPGSTYTTPDPHNVTVSAESAYSFYNTEYHTRPLAQK